LRPRAIGHSECCIYASRMLKSLSELSGVVGEVPRSFRLALLLGDFFRQAVGHGGSFARHVHVERCSTGDRRKCCGCVHGKTDRSKRGRIEENGLAALATFRVGPERLTRRKRCASVNGVDGRINRPPFVPNGGAVVHVREQI